jgi:hypothetical protein
MRKRTIGLALFLAACGDPIADGSYLGEPLLRLEGRIAGDAGTSDIRNPFVGISWLNLDQTQMESFSTTAPISRERFTGAFSIDVYDPPPAGAFTKLGPTRFAVGLPVALDDVDGDGTFVLDGDGRVAPPDRLFGIATDGGGVQVILFVDEPGSGTCAIPTGDEPPPPGFHLARFGTCAGPFALLPDGTPLRLELFPPAQEPPARLLEPEEECIVDCLDPANPQCAEMGGMLACIDERCGPVFADFDTCLVTHCLDGFEIDDACLAAHCAREDAAMNACSMSCWWMPACDQMPWPLPEFDAGVSK